MKCTTCGESKPVDAFRTKARMRQCRKCESAKRMERAKSNARARMGAIEAYRRYHAKKPQGYRPRDYKAEYQKHKTKKLIRAETKRLIERGLLPKADCCELCGHLNVEVHHLSYNEPNNVMWLCHECHILQHRMTLMDVERALAK